jgi:hypothetical protein
MEDSIATYEDVQFGLRRRFELYPDRIRVTGRGHSFGRFDETVMLAILRPHPNRVWLRGKLFQYGRAALACAAGIAALSGAAGGLEALTGPWGVWVIGPLAGAGLGLLLANVRPMEFARFPTDAGVIALSVGRTGPRAQEFDEFVDRLIELIQRARSTAQPTRPQH